MKNFLNKLYWPNTIFLVVTPLLMFTLAPWHLYMNGIDWRLLLFFAIYSVLTSMSITAGYHRLISHKSYETHPFVKFLYLLFGSAQFQGSALKWCSDHRRHHKYVDTEIDPYTISRGFFYAHVGWVFLKDDPKHKFDFESDLKKDPLILWQNKYCVPLSVIMGFLLPMGVGALMGSPWGGLIFGGFCRVVITQHCTFFINSFCHTFGSKPFSDENTSRDSFFMALFTFGEGYHNFHHKFQADYRNGVRWFDWDPTKWLIRFLNLIGLAKQLKRIPTNEIVKAKLNMQEKTLLKIGAPADRVESLRLRISGAQAALRKLKDDYSVAQRNWQNSDQMIKFKTELRLAQGELKFAYRQWRSYYRALKHVG